MPGLINRRNRFIHRRFGFLEATLNSGRVGAVGPVLADYAAGGVDPSAVFDFAGVGINANGTPWYHDGTNAVAFGDILTFARAGNGWHYNSSGLLVQASADVPRIDYDPATGVSRGLLIEGARTNLMPNSSSPALGNYDVGVVQTSGHADPTGGSGAIRIMQTAVTDAHGRAYSAASAFTWTVGTTYTYSVMLRPVGGQRYAEIRLPFQRFDNTLRYAVFDLSGSGAVHTDPSGSAKIQQLSGGWYRCSITLPCVLSGTADQNSAVFVRMFDDTPASSFAGDESRGLDMFCFQVEAAASASSPIITTGAPATRAAETCRASYLNFASGWDRGAHTIISEQDWADFNGASRYAYSVYSAIGAYSSVNETLMFWDLAGPNKFKHFYHEGNSAWFGTNGIEAATITNPGGSYKFATAVATNNFAGARNGGNLVTDTSGTVTAGTLSEIAIGHHPNGASQTYGHIKLLRFWPQRLSNAVLTAETA